MYTTIVSRSIANVHFSVKQGNVTSSDGGVGGYGNGCGSVTELEQSGGVGIVTRSAIFAAMCTFVPSSMVSYVQPMQGALPHSMSPLQCASNAGGPPVLEADEADEADDEDVDPPEPEPAAPAAPASPELDDVEADEPSPASEITTVDVGGTV